MLSVSIRGVTYVLTSFVRKYPLVRIVSFFKDSNEKHSQRLRAYSF